MGSVMFRRSTTQPSTVMWKERHRAKSVKGSSNMPKRVSQILLVLILTVLLWVMSLVNFPLLSHKVGRQDLPDVESNVIDQNFLDVSDRGSDIVDQETTAEVISEFSGDFKAESDNEHFEASRPESTSKEASSKLSSFDAAADPPLVLEPVQNKDIAYISVKMDLPPLRPEKCPVRKMSGSGNSLECGRNFVDEFLGMRVTPFIKDREIQVVTGQLTTFELGICEGDCKKLENDPSRLTIWGRLVEDSKKEGKLFNVDVEPFLGVEDNSCRWRVSFVVEVEGVYTLELLYSWYNGLNHDVMVSLFEEERSKKRHLGMKLEGTVLPRNETRFYENFHRQNRWIECNSWCLMHPHCNAWDFLGSRSANKGQIQLYYAERGIEGCHLYGEGHYDTVGKETEQPDRHAFGILDDELTSNERVVYLGGLSVERKQQKACRALAAIEGAPLKVIAAGPSSPDVDRPLLCKADSLAREKVGYWEPLPSDHSCPLNPVLNGTDQCAVNDENWQTYMSTIIEGPRKNLVWRHAGCAYRFFSNQDVKECLERTGITHVLFADTFYIMTDLRLRYSEAFFGDNSPSIIKVNGPWQHKGGRMVEARDRLPEDANAVWVIGSGETIFSSVSNVDFKNQAQDIRRWFEAWAGEELNVFYDPGPELHEWNYKLYDTMPRRKE